MTVYSQIYGRLDKVISFGMHEHAMNRFLERDRRPPGLSKFEVVRDGDAVMLAYRVSHYEIENQRKTQRPNYFGGAPSSETITNWKPAFHTWEFAPIEFQMSVADAPQLDVPPLIKVGNKVGFTLDLPAGTAFSLEGAPDGMSLEPTTHILRFNPEARHMGRYTVTLKKGGRDLHPLQDQGPALIVAHHDSAHDEPGGDIYSRR